MSESSSTASQQEEQSDIPPAPLIPQAHVNGGDGGDGGSGEEVGGSDEEFSIEKEVSEVPSSCMEYLLEEGKKKSKFHKAFYTLVAQMKKRMTIFILIILLIFIVFVLVFAIIAIYYSAVQTHLCYGDTTVDMLETGQDGLFIKGLTSPKFHQETINGVTKYVAEFEELKIIGDSPSGPEFEIQYNPSIEPTCDYLGPIRDLIEKLYDTECSCTTDENGNLLSLTCYTVASSYTMIDGECTSVFIQLGFTFEEEQKDDNNISPSSEIVVWKALCGTKSSCSSLIRYYSTVGFVPNDNDNNEVDKLKKNIIINNDKNKVLKDEDNITIL